MAKNKNNRDAVAAPKHREDSSKPADSQGFDKKLDGPNRPST
ncbi:hypothetical protein [Paenibacillus sp. MMS18-CY102]|nr:hypothetical protein [Paenibacillus sp. MMS18-CY102]